jgi:predicted nuclease of restriction endonuclease-like RecB superfamily
VLTKDLLRVSRAGGGYRPQFVDDSARDLAARVIGVYQGHVGEPRSRLSAALTDLEREAEAFKLVRGFAKLLERETTAEMRSPLPPRRTRRAAFEAAEAVGVATESDREAAIARAADRLAVDAAAVEDSLYADLPDRQVLTAVGDRYDPETLVEQYNLSLAQTALFDATAVTVRSDDPKAVISAVKRLRLMYEIRRTDEGRVVEVTGLTALFRSSRRYGTRFARLLRSVAGTADWRLTATIDDDGTEREMTLTDADVSVPGVDPVTEVTFDSGVEADFAARFDALELDWTLTREPEPLAAGEHVVVPDFAFDYAFGDFRVFFEIVGFWTPEYLEKKRSRLAELEAVEMLVAVDDSLGVGEDIATQGHDVLTYSGTVRLKDVRNALRRYERELEASARDRLPETLDPDADVITLAEVAAEYGVSEAVVEDLPVADHERIGRTLVRPSVLEAAAEDIADGMAYADAEAALAAHGIEDASAALSRLGYRVEWAGLDGGTVREQ